MAKGKFERAEKHRKVLALLLSIVLLLTLVVGGTFAYVVTQSSAAENRFVKAYVTTSVNDAGQVSNNGNVDAYIRTTVVVNWMDNNGNVYGIKPNYTVSVNSGWSQNADDEFYYYTSVVKAFGGTTVTAPVTVTVTDTAPSSAYSLSIEIVAEGIQAEGDTDIGNIPAYKDAWKIES